MSEKRRRFWIESKIQGAIIQRFIFYWCAAWLFVVGLSFLGASSYAIFLGEMSFVEMVRMGLGRLWLPIGMSVVCLPAIIRDYIHLSHRFCGPMVRFRRAVKQLAKGEPVDIVKLRDGDYWTDFAEDLNQLIRRHNQAFGQDDDELAATVDLGASKEEEATTEEPVGV